MAIFQYANLTGTGIHIALIANQDLIIADGVQVVSENDSAIIGSGNNEIYLNSNTFVGSFSSSSADAAIDLSQGLAGDAKVIISQSAAVYGAHSGITTDIGGGDIFNYGTITAARFNAVEMEGTLNTLVNHGSISAEFIGARLWQYGSITNYGGISGGSYGVALRDGGGEVVNSGQIAGSRAVYLSGLAATFNTPNQLTNTGDILGEVYGIETNAEAAKIVNSGVISASFTSGTAIYHDGAASVFSAPYVLRNTGDVIGTWSAYFGGVIADYVHNSGVMIGDVQLNNGNDRYFGSTGTLEGDLFGGVGEDLLIGGDADNLIDGGADNDRIIGNGGDDTLYGDLGEDVLRGDDGHDDIYGGSGYDTLRGGDDNDNLYGGNEDDALFGGAGDDNLYGGANADDISGGIGNDRIDGGSSADMVRGGDGDDVLIGGTGLDGVYGGRGNDSLYGGNNPDDMRGGEGDDTLVGGSGGDTLNGGKGEDELRGSGGADVFAFNRKAGNDHILDFENGVDLIDLTAFGLRPADYAAIVAPAVSNPGGGAAFIDLAQLGGEGSILIEGLTFGNVGASDFIL